MYWLCLRVCSDDGISVMFSTFTHNVYFPFFHIHTTTTTTSVVGKKVKFEHEQFPFIPLSLFPYFSVIHEEVMAKATKNINVWREKYNIFEKVERKKH